MVAKTITATKEEVIEPKPTGIEKKEVKLPPAPSGSPGQLPPQPQPQLTDTQKLAVAHNKLLESTDKVIKELAQAISLMQIDVKKNAADNDVLEKKLDLSKREFDLIYKKITELEKKVGE